MSLLSEAMETCHFLEKTRVNDGYGGYGVEWADGIEFQAAIVFDTSIEARRAEKEGVKNLYTITTSRDVPLAFNDFIKRESDEKIFKITSDGADKKSPLSSSLDMRVVTAEQIERLPDN